MKPQFGSANDTTQVVETEEGKAIAFDQLMLNALNTAPASAVDTGIAGEIRVAADYIYVCTATDTWVRAAIATW